MSAPRTEPIFLVRLKAKPPTTGVAGPSSKEQEMLVAVERARQEGAFYAAAAQAGDAAAQAKVKAAEAALIKARVALEAARKERRGKPVPKPAIPEPEPENITGVITSFVYEDSEKKTDLLKLTLRNEDLRFFDHPIFQKGTMLVVQWGYPNNLSPARQCFVKKVKGSTTLTVEADDRGALMNKQTRSRTFKNVKRSDVARTIAMEQGFGNETLFIDDTKVTFPSIAQAAMTDAQFLKKLADLEGYEFFVDFDGFHWRPRLLTGKPVRKLTYYLPPNVGDIIAFDVENDVTAKPGAVGVKGRNPLAKSTINVTADATNTPRDTLAPNQEIVAQPPPVTFIESIDPRTGEAKVMQPSPAKNAGAKDPSTTGAVSPSSATTAEQAKREATGQFIRTQQGSVILTATILGDPQLAAKSIIQIDGLGKRLSGRYYLTECQHKIDGSGYITTLKARTDGTNKGKATKKDKGKPNDKNADAGKAGPNDIPPPLTAVDSVDPRTGETKTIYKDMRGKQ